MGAILIIVGLKVFTTDLKMGNFISAPPSPSPSQSRSSGSDSSSDSDFDSGDVPAPRRRSSAPSGEGVSERGFRRGKGPAKPGVVKKTVKKVGEAAAVAATA